MRKKKSTAMQPPAKTASVSITEDSNFISADVDLASSEEMVRILRQTDAQMFAGYLRFPGLYDKATLDTMVRLVGRCARTLANPKGSVILSGAGTSGRLAMLTARLFNQLVARPQGNPAFRYLIAGGLPALIQAQEGAEDDPHQGMRDLENSAAGADDVFYVGITCGLSAPYIAGQLEWMMNQPRRGFAALLGFNPVDLARNTPIENWNGSFRETARRLAVARNAAVLNPVIGPEPVTGSTRMKGGSATKILLESLFHSAIALRRSPGLRKHLKEHILEILQAEERACRAVYLQLSEISGLIDLGAAALRSHNHIYYLGAADPKEIASGTSRSAQAGILGLIDASECPPTYGADFEDVRGFIAGGWKALVPGGGEDLSNRGGHFDISLDAFRKHKLPYLTEDDLCVFLGNFRERDELIRQVSRAGAKTAAVSWSSSHNLPKLDSVVSLDRAQPLQLQIKLVLNALTTGAHVLAGKVFGNRMIDLRISNNKLYHRTIGIISKLMKVSEDEARAAMLKAVFQTDRLTASQASVSIAEIIEAAKPVQKIVPKSLLLATGKFNVRDVDAVLRKNPIVRSVIQKYAG